MPRYLKTCSKTEEIAAEAKRIELNFENNMENYIQNLQNPEVKTPAEPLRLQPANNYIRLAEAFSKIDNDINKSEHKRAEIMMLKQTTQGGVQEADTNHNDGKGF